MGDGLGESNRYKYLTFSQFCAIYYSSRFIKTKMSAKIKKQPNPDLAHDERGSVPIPVPHPHLPHIQTHTPVFVQNFLDWLKAIKFEQYAIAAAIASQVLLAAYFANFLTPRSVSYSFANTSCSNNLILLPRLHRTNQTSAYRLETSGGLKVAGYPLSSTSVCVTPYETPNAGTDVLKLSPAALPFLSQKTSVNTPALPLVSGVETIEKMPTNVPAVFTLNQADKTFAYKLSANNFTSDCSINGTELVCNTDELKLKQSTKYDFKLERYFAGTPVETLFQKTISTIEAITVKSTSVKEGQIIYGKPKTFTIEFSKVLASYDEVALTNLDSGKAIPTTVEIKDESLIISTSVDLPRQANFALSVSQVTAPDLSSLAGSYSLKFSTSGGPKVAGVSIGSYGVYTPSNITLSFDSPIAKSQNLLSFVTVSTASGNVTVNAYVNGSTITIDPISNLPKCTAFTVSILDGIGSVYGITGGSTWTFNSRTICRSEFSIGTSVLGRSLMAYKFGNGPNTVLFFGNMHGDEASGKYTLNSWIDELEAKYDQIPANRTIVVIPSINPDGLNTGSRYNSRQVDLNRNFPDVDWQAGVQVAGGEILANNGGTSPLSEPEAAALASYIQATSPRLILSYHAVGSFIVANEAGDSTALANTYASLSNYWAPSAAQSSGLFGYQITGTLEGWAYSVLGIPTLVIEQSTYYGNEFYSNQNAMWAMVNLP